MPFARTTRLPVALGAALAVSACAALKSESAAAPLTQATVTSIASGRANVPDERMYGLRTPGGRVYFVTQALKKPLQEGEVVAVEVGTGGVARIRER